MKTQVPKSASQAYKDKQFLLRLKRLRDEYGPVEGWSFTDACRWLELDTRHTWGDQLQDFLDAFERRLNSCADTLGDKKVRGFLKVHRELWCRFSKHFTLLLKRRVREES